LRLVDVISGNYDLTKAEAGPVMQAAFWDKQSDDDLPDSGPEFLYTLLYRPVFDNSHNHSEITELSFGLYQYSQKLGMYIIKESRWHSDLSKGQIVLFVRI